MQEMKNQLDFLRFKKWYYKTSVEAGTEAIHFTPGTRFVDPMTHEQYRNELQKTTNLHELIDLR